MSENMHEHDHEHDHDHEHLHAHEGIDSVEKLTALLKYMHHHNVHHTEELSGLKDALTALGKADLVPVVDAIVKDYTSGNEKLGELLKKL